MAISLRNIIKLIRQQPHSCYSPNRFLLVLVNARSYCHFPEQRLTIFKFQKNKANNSRRLLMAVTFAQISEWVGVKREGETEIKKLINKAKEMLEDGNIDQAIELYNRALQQAISYENEQDECHIKEQLAMIAFSLRKFGDAEKLLLEAKNYFTDSKTNDDLRMTHITLRLAETYEYLSNYESAQQCYDACASKLKPKMKEALEKKDHETIELYLSFLASQAHYFLHRGNFEEAVVYFKDAYDTCQHVKGDINEHTLTLLYQLGAVCFQKGDLEIAVDYLKKAVEIGKHLPGMTTLSNIYVTLGNIYLKQGLIADAELLCNQARKNAIRHKYEKGIKEAEACLQELN